MKLRIGEIGSYRTRGGKTRWRLQYDERHIYGYDTEAEAKAAQAEMVSTGITKNPFIVRDISYKGVAIQQTASGYYTMPGYASKSLKHVEQRIEKEQIKTQTEVVQNEKIVSAIRGEESIVKGGANSGVSVVLIVLGCILVLWYLLLGNIRRG